jgi:hypothetical protein
MGEASVPAQDRERVFEAVCEPRAEIFSAGPPFVRGWAAARTASQYLAARLEDAGLTEDFGGLRADVSVSGQGLVCVGTLHAQAVRTLAVLLSRGLCAELEDTYAA